MRLQRSPHTPHGPMNQMQPWTPMPDEYPDCDLKANVHRRKRPRDMATLESNVRSHLRLISRKPQRVRAYFGAKHIQYAA